MLPDVFAIAAGCFLLERLSPGWSLPSVRTWPLRVVAVDLVQLAVVLLAVITWARWLSAFSLLHLSRYADPWLAGFIAYFAATSVFYWWHRARHEIDLLWRIFHQIRHSPQRIEVNTSFYKHPVEMVVNSVIGSVLVYTLLGLTVESAAIYTFFTAVGEFFYRTSVRTPRWWDMLFGTYENPPRFLASCGFDDAKERLLPMLAFTDVHKGASAGAAQAPAGAV
jgi:sterol desaturase/sphingolipid hydroxylase (fatty acid hydroxylase superfamily)